MQLSLPLDFLILSIEQQDHGKHRKIWLTLYHALDYNASESLTIVISVDNLPGLTGQKQVEDVSNGGTRCSVMSTKLFSPDDLQSMKQACIHRTATLTQKHKVDKSILVDVYTLEKCNGSCYEVKALRKLREWCSDFTPPAALPSGEAGFSQPLIAALQHAPQIAYPCYQPEVTSPIPSNKRTRTGSGLQQEQRQARTCFHATNVSC